MIFLNRIHYIVPRKATPSKIILWFFNSVAVCFFINLKILPLKQFNFLVSSLEGAYHYFYRSFFSLRIVFGGIEELGWRYSFQPSLEKKISYCFNADYFCVLGCMASLVLLYWRKFRDHSCSRFFTRITNQLFYSVGIICLFQ